MLPVGGDGEMTGREKVEAAFDTGARLSSLPSYAMSRW